MLKVYSTYEAKARFSEILRKVRGGESVYVTYRGKRVAEIRPLEKSETAEEQLRKLEEHGWNITKTAKAIQTPRSNLYKKLDQHGIRRGDDAKPAAGERE